MGSGSKGLYQGAAGPVSKPIESRSYVLKKRLYQGVAGPVSKPGDVRYNTKKTEGYLLNPNHPVGGPKAKFMHDVLGYSQSDGKLFHKKVVKAIQDKKPDKTEITPYGIKHTYHTKLVGKNRKSVSANVVVVIQKDNSRKTFKIVTVYPDKRGEK